MPNIFNKDGKVFVEGEDQDSIIVLSEDNKDVFTEGVDGTMDSEILSTDINTEADPQTQIDILKQGVAEIGDVENVIGVGVFE